MEAMLGIFLHSYFYLKLAKNNMSFLLSLMFSLQQNRGRGWKRFCLEVGQGGNGGGNAQTVYTHVSKCKNDEIKIFLNSIRT
jgi:hypothetical protein